MSSLSLFFLLSLAKGLSSLFIFSKNELLVLLIFAIVLFVSISFISALIFMISFLLLTMGFVLFCFCHTHDFSFFSWPEPGEISNPFFSFPIHLSCFLYFGLAISLHPVYLIGAGLTQHPNPLITEAKKIEVNFPLALITQG